MPLRASALPLALLLFSLPGYAAPRPPATPIQITADLTDAPRKLYHAEIDLPVTPGPLTLITPQWIPGSHGPRGPIADLTGLVFTADGKTLPWRRDDVDIFEYHLTIPAGVATLHAHLDSIVDRAASRTNMAVLEWETPHALPRQQPRPRHRHPAHPSSSPPAGASAPPSSPSPPTTLSTPPAAPSTTPPPPSRCSKTPPS